MASLAGGELTLKIEGLDALMARLTAIVSSLAQRCPAFCDSLVGTFDRVDELIVLEVDPSRATCASEIVMVAQPSHRLAVFMAAASGPEPDLGAVKQAFDQLFSPSGAVSPTPDVPAPAGADAPSAGGSPSSRGAR